MKGIIPLWNSLHQSIQHLLLSSQNKESFINIYHTLSIQSHSLTSQLFKQLNTEPSFNNAYNIIIQSFKKAFYHYQNHLQQLSQSQPHTNNQDQITIFLNNRQPLPKQPERDEIYKYLYKAEQVSNDTNQLLLNLKQLSFQQKLSKHFIKDLNDISTQTQPLPQHFKIFRIQEITIKQLLNKSNKYKQLTKSNKQLELQTNNNNNNNINDNIINDNITNNSPGLVKKQEIIKKKKQNKNQKDSKLDKNQKIQYNIPVIKNKLNYQNNINSVNKENLVQINNKFELNLINFQQSNQQLNSDANIINHQALRQTQFAQKNQIINQNNNHNYQIKQFLTESNEVKPNDQDSNNNNNQLKVYKQSNLKQQSYSKNKNNNKKKTYELSNQLNKSQNLNKQFQLKNKTNFNDQFHLKNNENFKKPYQISLEQKKSKNQCSQTQNQEKYQKSSLLPSIHIQTHQQNKQKSSFNSLSISNQQKSKRKNILQSKLSSLHINQNIKKNQNKQSINKVTALNKQSFGQASKFNSQIKIKSHLVQMQSRLMKQLEQIIKGSKGRYKNNKIKMYIQFIQTLHQRQCGPNCRHLKRFYDFLKKSNIPSRQQILVHKHTLDMSQKS